MTKIRLLPIRKVPEVSSTDKLADVLWLSEASKKLFRYLFGVNLFTGMLSHIPGLKSGI